MVDYDEGEVTTLDLLNVPPNGLNTEIGSEKDLEEVNDQKKSRMDVECDGNICYPKYK
jgi:hypothetical protein